MAQDYVEARIESESFSCDNVRVHRLSGREAIGKLFSFDIEIVSTDPEEPSAEAMTGAEVTLVFAQREDGSEVRRIHGMVAEVDEMLETEVESRSYKLHFVPRAHRLTLVETQEIYMDLSVPEIIQQKLELVGLVRGDVELRLRATYPKLEFVVQYRESDLAFISRIAEHIGVSFFFEHKEGRDVMVFTDEGGFQPIPGRGAVPFQPRGEKHDVFHLEAKTRVIPANYVLQDYNYRTPHLDLTATYESPVGFGGGVVEYGAHFKTPEAGLALAKIRGQEREAMRRVYSGKSDVRQLAAGATFVLEGHARREDASLLVVEVEHSLTQVVGTHGGTDGERYANSFRAIDASLTFRPARATPKPRIHGVITGVVEQDPEIATGKYAKLDEQGRYTVRFLFDTAPSGQRKASRPVRMVQPHVGPDYGMHFPLKPGIEVLLAFVDGDPDRPLIVGAVPNPETPSPVTRSNSLANRIKTASGIVLEMKDS